LKRPTLPAESTKIDVFPFPEMLYLSFEVLRRFFFDINSDGRAPPEPRVPSSSVSAHSPPRPISRYFYRILHRSRSQTSCRSICIFLLYATTKSCLLPPFYFSVPWRILFSPYDFPYTEGFSVPISDFRKKAAKLPLKVSFFFPEAPNLPPPPFGYFRIFQTKQAPCPFLRSMPLFTQVSLAFPLC